ncbi:MAG: ammonium transporter [Alphaproteobacteria bacterium]|jgi:Amt family ammonium transporter|nr:ammonium transporter [Alphaproteobacteria bacterium]
MQPKNRAWLVAGAVGALAVAAGPALAQDGDVAALRADMEYVFNTLLFLIGGFLVMWMAAGFAMLEAGLVRKKSVGVQCLKNITLYSIAGLMFWVVGYNLMYVGVDGGYFGSFTPWSAGAPTVDDGYSLHSDWFFQMVFVATAASIVSGTVAERIKVVPFLIFVAVLTGIFYPITGSWGWGGGWLAEMGFSDFAGSTIVHSVGGWAALAGAIVLGARRGRFTPDGKPQPMPGSSLPLATLGTFILWLGWFGFNGASQLALGTVVDADSVARIFMNTNLAAAGGVVAAMITCLAIYQKVDLSLVLNGAIGGLVSITAEPLTPLPLAAILIGAVGGVLIVITVPLLDKLKIDDVVGAIPAHLVCGIWGTIVVPLTNADASYATQAIGIAAFGLFTFVASLIVWSVLRAVVGIRIREEDEDAGIDQIELGIDAYPEFGRTMAY